MKSLTTFVVGTIEGTALSNVLVIIYVLDLVIYLWALIHFVASTEYPWLKGLYIFKIVSKTQDG